MTGPSEPHPGRPPLRLIAACLAVNLAAVLALTGSEALPVWMAPYFHPASLFRTLAVINLGFTLFVAPMLIGVQQRPSVAGTLLCAAALALLAAPFLAIAARANPQVAQASPAALLARTVVILFVLDAALILFAALAERWYSPLACAVCAVPPLADYLILDVMGASTSFLFTISPFGVLLRGVQGAQPDAGGLGAWAGVALYSGLFVTAALVAPLPAGRGSAEG